WPLPKGGKAFTRDVGRESGDRSCRCTKVHSSEGEMTMQIGNSKWSSAIPAVLVSLLLSSLFSFAAHGAELRGTVSDPLGAVVPHAEVTLLRDNTALAQTTSNDLGEFAFLSLSTGRYRVRAMAPGFAEQESPDVYVGGEKATHIVLPLKIGTVTQQVGVSATGTPALDSQVECGSSGRRYAHLLGYGSYLQRKNDVGTV